jgi:hypothetical protein
MDRILPDTLQIVVFILRYLERGWAGGGAIVRARVHVTAAGGVSGEM